LIVIVFIFLIPYHYSHAIFINSLIGLSQPSSSAKGLHATDVISVVVIGSNQNPSYCLTDQRKGGNSTPRTTASAQSNSDESPSS
tara:strand:- start:247 stop:501 length:255 start_codon:yes stop_codon:yes gene_type:complete